VRNRGQKTLLQISVDKRFVSVIHSKVKMKRKRLIRGIHETERGSGIYSIQYTDARGRQRREKAGTYDDAIDLLLIRQTDALRGRPRRDLDVNLKSVLFSELIDDATAYAYRNNDPYVALDLSRKFEKLRPEFGNAYADTIRKADIESWLDRTGAERQWKPSSRNRYQSAISLIFRVAVENEKLAKNPATGIRLRQENNARARYLSRQEEERLLNVVRTKYPEYLPHVILSIHTGMRASEQLRMRAGDYNPDSGTLAVHQTKDRTKSAVRYVPLTPMAVEAYSQLAQGKEKGDLLSIDKFGYPMTGFAWFARAVREAQVDEYTWHSNRHTACSRWVMAGVPLAVVSKYAGHANITMTMRYSHLQPNNNDQAVAAMMSYYG
jgi:integrase